MFIYMYTHVQIPSGGGDNAALLPIPSRCRLWKRNNNSYNNNNEKETVKKKKKENETEKKSLTSRSTAKTASFDTVLYCSGQCTMCSMYYYYYYYYIRYSLWRILSIRVTSADNDNDTTVRRETGTRRAPWPYRLSIRRRARGDCGLLRARFNHIYKSSLASVSR